jgi:hypothetical protein
MKVDRLLYAGNNLDKARKLFSEAIKHRRASCSRSDSGREYSSNGQRNTRG